MLHLPRSFLKCRVRASERASYTLNSFFKTDQGNTADCTRRIAEGQFYEAHQQLRVVASRYVKTEKWDEALDVLEGGALALLRAGQGGSGGDLCLYFVDVLNKAEREPGGAEKGRVWSAHDNWEELRKE